MSSLPVSDRTPVNEQFEVLALIGHWLIRLLVALLLLPATGVWAQNFSSTEPELIRLAEAAREQSAHFWSGHPLPGSWYQPCPLQWSERTGPGSGWTAFQIQNGEVFGWQMTLRGDRRTVFRDVIPHEVDHAVRASLCRRPLPRWLDEGCASLFESAESHEQLRRQLLASRERCLTAATIDRMSYPSSGTDTAKLYAEGFSLVEFLLARGTPRELLQLQLSSEPLSRSLVTAYRSDLPSLLLDWQKWERGRLASGPRCDCVHCPWHRRPAATRIVAPPTTNTKPTLTFWTASWCAPCLKFHQDLTNQPQFRERLEARFTLIKRDIDRLPEAAQQARITSVPIFEANGHRISGYLGPDWLLQQLGLGPVASPPISSPSAPVETPVLPSVPPQASEPTTSPENQRPTLPPSVTLPAPAETTQPQPPQPVADPILKPPVQASPDRPAPPESLPPKSSSPWGRMLEFAPTAISILSSVGIIGGTAVTGGAGGVALMILLKLLKRRATQLAQSKSQASGMQPEGGAVISARAPFPRQLDEAGELLGLRQSEGRVATLDTLRGMFLDDELDKLKNDPDTQVATLVRRIREAVDTRVDEVAPLTTKV